MPELKSINKSIADYEAWLGTHPNADDPTLAEKVKKIRKGGAFALLRATFHRWIEQWSAAKKTLQSARAPVVLAVGDLHADNFGTWRDVHGQRVWGVNDFDEACELPFSSDLTRLAVSIALAHGDRFELSPDDVAAALLEGYRAHLAMNGGPIFPDATARAPLGELLAATTEDDFWDKMKKKDDFAPCSRDELRTACPEVIEGFDSVARGRKDVDFSRVQKAIGLGSLGRRRYRMVIGTGPGRRCIEAKALVPSAAARLAPKARRQSQTGELLRRAIRSPDAVLRVGGTALKPWLIREVGPEAVKIEIATLAEDAPKLLRHHEPALLRTMGVELANIHLGSTSRDTLLAALEELPLDWLAHDAAILEKAMRSDWEDWSSAHRKNDD